MVRLSGITIVVDTTATFDDVRMSRTRWMQLLSLCAKGRVRIAIPVVVLRETARHWRSLASEAVESARLRNDRAIQGRKWFADLGLGNLGEPPSIPAVVIDEDAYRGDLVTRLTNLGVDILPLPQVGIEEMLDRDLGRRKPFDDSGKGFRDALIWHSLKELLGELTGDDTVYFVTNNTNDYCLNGDFHPDLIAELASLDVDLRHVTTLEDLVATDVMASLVAELATTDEALSNFLRGAIAESVEEPGEPNVAELVLEAVESAANRLIGEEIDTEVEMGSGLDFRDVWIPRQIETPTIAHVEPDPGTAEWEVYETYEGGTLLIRASIDAHVDIEGFVYKADYYGMEDKVELLKFDWNDHYAFVSASTEARLVFQIRVEPEVGLVETTEFEMAESLWLPEG